MPKTFCTLPAGSEARERTRYWVPESQVGITVQAQVPEESPTKDWVFQKGAACVTQLPFHHVLWLGPELIATSTKAMPESAGFLLPPPPVWSVAVPLSELKAL